MESVQKERETDSARKREREETERCRDMNYMTVFGVWVFLDDSRFVVVVHGSM